MKNSVPEDATGYLVRLSDGDESAASALLPEFRRIYEFIDGWLCRGDGIDGYPETLPSGYCEFFAPPPASGRP